VARFSSQDTIIYSVIINSIKNMPFTKRDINLVIDILGLSNFAAKEKTT